jgi:hypothetical protein
MVSEYEYVIDGGLENEDQEIYLDVNFPEYMVRPYLIFKNNFDFFRSICWSSQWSPATSTKLENAVHWVENSVSGTRDSSNSVWRS